MNALEQNLKEAKQGSRANLLRRACVFAVALALFAVVLLLVYFTHIVSFRISPQLAAERADVAVTDGVGLTLFDSVYLLGGRATLRFDSPGFVSREVAVDSPEGVLVVEMREAPVNVVITTEPPLPQTRWRVNGAYATTAERFAQAMLPGAVGIEINHEFHRVETLQVDVKTGRDFAQHVNLTPVVGNLNIRSEPAGAMVVLDGEKRGATPLELAAVAGGLHDLKVVLDGYQTVEETIAVTNKLADVARDYRLKPQRTEALVTASPAGGVLRVNGVAAEWDGALPLSLPLSAGKKYVLQYEKPGYFAVSQEVTLKPNERADIKFPLVAEMGEVVIRSSPPADLFVNDKPAGVTPQALRLQALPQKIALRLSGYRAVELSVTPSAAAPLLIEEQLQTELAARLSRAPPLLTAAAGVKMKFFNPRIQSQNRFTMGAPKSEKFRRANEFQRQVNLTKSFYISATEITEAQFANYKPIQVAGKNLPVRNVSWLDAAGFCNWMSARDGLQPAYQITGGRLHGFDATADGYRLPSEAEWEWLARVAGRPQAARFVWGDDTTIPAGSGNFADESAKGGVAKYIPRYNDGFAGVAPVASFTADAVGLYDMAGNVSEWVHDRYSLQPPAPGQVETNPFGGRHGDGRVIKGANFRSASVTGLRSSFREGLLKGRDDVGFRVARYLYGKEE